VAVIPFYGVEQPGLFAIERQAMDRAGLVLAALDRILPATGTVLDVGAGDGFTASRLQSVTRRLVCLEPAMSQSAATSLTWIRGAAPDVALQTNSVVAAYSTWAYFFPEFLDISAGLNDLNRVVKPGGPIVLVDNAGDDAFCAMAPQPIATAPSTWEALGFEVEVIETAFEFDSLADAERLLTFFFGDRAEVALTVEFKVGVAVRFAD